MIHPPFFDDYFDSAKKPLHLPFELWSGTVFCSTVFTFSHLLSLLKTEIDENTRGQDFQP
jgi:hypothetical protein